MKTTIPAPKPFPVDSLPRIVRAYTLALVETFDVEPAAIALPCLVAIAGSIGSARAVRIREGWVEPSALYGCLVAPAGMVHTSLLSWCLGPSPASRYSLPTYSSLLHQLANEPRGLLLTCEDLSCIVEKVENPSGLAMLMSAGYRGGDYVKGSADGTIAVQLEKCLISLAGVLHPAQYLNATARRSPTSLLLINRFLPALLDKPGKYDAGGPPDAARKAYDALLWRLADLDYEPSQLPGWQAKELALEGEALKIFDAWAGRRIASVLENDGELDPRLCKIDVYCVRFALLFALCDAIAGDLPSEQIVASNMIDAIEVIEWFADESVRLKHWRGVHSEEAAAIANNGVAVEGGAS